MRKEQFKWAADAPVVHIFGEDVPREAEPGKKTATPKPLTKTTARPRTPVQPASNTSNVKSMLRGLTTTADKPKITAPSGSKGSPITGQGALTAGAATGGLQEPQKMAKRLEAGIRQPQKDEPKSIAAKENVVPIFSQKESREPGLQDAFLRNFQKDSLKPTPLPLFTVPGEVKPAVKITPLKAQTQRSTGAVQALGSAATVAATPKPVQQTTTIKPLQRGIVKPTLAPELAGEQPALTGTKPVTQPKLTLKDQPKAILAPELKGENPTVSTPKRTMTPNTPAKAILAPELKGEQSTKTPASHATKPLSRGIVKPILAPELAAEQPEVTEETAGKFVVDQMNGFLENAGTYMDEYNARFGSRKGGLADAYVGDSQEFLDAAYQKTQSLITTADAIRAVLHQYGSTMDPEDVEAVTKTLDEIMAQVRQMFLFAQQDNAYWNSWGSASTDNSAEDVYRKAQQEQMFSEKYAGKSGTELVNLINFIEDEDEKAWVTGEALRTISFDEASEDLADAKYALAELESLGRLINAAESGLVVDEKQVAAAYERRKEIYEKYGVKSYDDLRDMITRNQQLITESQKVQEYIRLSSVQENKDFEKYAKEGEAEAKEYAQKNNKTEHMTVQEIQILAYYIAKDKENGTNLAEQYKAAIKHYLKHRRAQEIADNINGIDIPVIEGLTRIGYSLGSGVVDWGLDLAQNFTNQKIDPTVMQMANGYIGSDPSLNGFDRVAHQAAGAVGYMAPSILLSKGVGGLTGMASLGSAVGSTAMFLGSAGNAYGEALDKGYGQPAARAYSALVGLSEVTLQNILGGISEFGGLPAKLDGKISAIKNALLKGATKYGISLGGEILEEELQNFLEPAFRTIIFGEKYDMPTVQELIDTALVTALSTSAIEGPGITSETIQEHGNNNALKTATNSVQPEQSSPNAPETIDVGKIGWDGRVAVTEATGPKVTVDGKTYALIGKDANNFPVYQDVEVLKEQKEFKQREEAEPVSQEESALQETEMEENPEWFAAALDSAEAASADSRDNLTSVAEGHIMDLQSGFMCFPEGDPLIENSKNVAPKEGFFDVAMHGSPTAVAFGGREANMSPRLLAEVIRHNPNYHGENIRLLCCSTGLQVDGAYCFAEELANALGVTVEAPNMEVYTDASGNIKVGRYKEGRMIEYRPNERGRIK